MKNTSKYSRGYFLPPQKCNSWVEKDYIDRAPIWCSVDLRDGNQALVVPMTLDEKIEYFNFLVKIGFKEIEVGFPAASQTEYEFLRALIEGNLIPDDVTVQVLTQSREHIIKKTFEALYGVKNAIVHFYNSVSVAQREQVFAKSKSEIKRLAISGAKLVKKYAEQAEGNFRFEYSPESFTGAEPEYSLEVCNAVIDVLKPTPESKVIINLPVTVEMSLPHVYASQVEYMSKNLNSRENVILSLHPHNDRGCGVADAELGLLAGADRIEGTLFGNGERTGNVDIVTLAMNMFSHGVDPCLDFSDMPSAIEIFERVTDMKIMPRQPYCGSLVFAAFSGSHQDAIAKGMRYRVNNNVSTWSVPYLPIDPHDIGRQYESDVIRINSQSGKGGIGYILQTKYGYVLPSRMRESFGYEVKDISDKNHKELKPEEIYSIFTKNHLNIATPLAFDSVHYVQSSRIEAEVTVYNKGKKEVYTASGNGRLDSVVNALRDEFMKGYQLEVYEEHSLETGSTSKAAAYIGLVGEDGKFCWGAGTDEDIINASVKALICAINRIK
ncbi:MAG: 2-isopropylmalate synthase [Ruminococcaceae bacterium]|nr:2-isopropylmalate synthase [Oscillospiraceae bacterium]